jgi:HemY protein
VKAQRYLQQSLAMEPRVQTYRLLGDLAATQHDLEAASDYYKQGLELASDAFVEHIEELTV